MHRITRNLRSPIKKIEVNQAKEFKLLQLFHLSRFSLQKLKKLLKMIIICRLHQLEILISTYRVNKFLI